MRCSPHASECLKHDLLVAKLHTFCFFTNLLESCLICDALHNFEPCAQFTKREKHPWRRVSLKPEACNFTKNNTPPWVFFTFFKLYEWYQIAQSTTYLYFFCKHILNLHIFYTHILTLIRMDLFGASHGWGGKKITLFKICHTYPKMMKLGTVIHYLKKIKKTYKLRDTPWILLTSKCFHWKSATFFISRNIDIDCILIHNCWFF